MLTMTHMNDALLHGPDALLAALLDRIEWLKPAAEKREWNRAGIWRMI